MEYDLRLEAQTMIVEVLWDHDQNQWQNASNAEEIYKAKVQDPTEQLDRG